MEDERELVQHLTEILTEVKWSRVKLSTKPHYNGRYWQGQVEDWTFCVTDYDDRLFEGRSVEGVAHRGEFFYRIPRHLAAKAVELALYSETWEKR